MNQTNAKENIAAMNHSAILSMVITAICITLTYIFTAFINIRLPIAANGGLVHLGNVALFISAILFGKKTGALAGGIGMGLFDLLSGWTAWAPFTLIIVGIMGFVMGWMTEHKKTYPRIILAMIMVSAIKIVGYYLAGTDHFRSRQPGPDGRWFRDRAGSDWPHPQNHKTGGNLIDYKNHDSGTDTGPGTCPDRPQSSLRQPGSG